MSLIKIVKVKKIDSFYWCLVHLLRSAHCSQCQTSNLFIGFFQDWWRMWVIQQRNHRCGGDHSWTWTVLVLFSPNTTRFGSKCFVKKEILEYSIFHFLKISDDHSWKMYRQFPLTFKGIYVMSSDHQINPSSCAKTT